jgi:hypothetical protein
LGGVDSCGKSFRRKCADSGNPCANLKAGTNGNPATVRQLSASTRSRKIVVFAEAAQADVPSAARSKNQVVSPALNRNATGHNIATDNRRNRQHNGGLKSNVEASSKKGAKARSESRIEPPPTLTTLPSPHGTAIPQKPQWLMQTELVESLLSALGILGDRAVRWALAVGASPAEFRMLVATVETCLSPFAKLDKGISDFAEQLRSEVRAHKSVGLADGQVALGSSPQDVATKERLAAENNRLVESNTSLSAEISQLKRVALGSVDSMADLVEALAYSIEVDARGSAKYAAGIYDIVPRKARNEPPAWKQRGGTQFVYAGKAAGQWLIGNASEFKRGTGMIRSKLEYRSALPSVMPIGTWQRFFDVDWVDDPSILVSRPAASTAVMPPAGKAADFRGGLTKLPAGMYAAAKPGGMPVEVKSDSSHDVFTPLSGSPGSDSSEDAFTPLSGSAARSGSAVPFRFQVDDERRSRHTSHSSYSDTGLSSSGGSHASSDIRSLVSSSPEERVSNHSGAHTQKDKKKSHRSGSERESFKELATEYRPRKKNKNNQEQLADPPSSGSDFTTDSDDDDRATSSEGEASDTRRASAAPKANARNSRLP